MVVLVFAFRPGAVSWRRLSKPSSLVDDGKRCSRYAGFEQASAYTGDTKGRTHERHVCWRMRVVRVVKSGSCREAQIIQSSASLDDVKVEVSKVSRNWLAGSAAGWILFATPMEETES